MREGAWHSSHFVSAPSATPTWSNPNADRKHTTAKWDQNCCSSFKSRRFENRNLPGSAASLYRTLVQLVSQMPTPTIRIWIPRSTHVMGRSANTQEQLL